MWDTRKQYLATIIATGLQFCLGMSYGWISPIESQITADADGKCARDFCLTRYEVTWVAGSMLMGSLAASLTSGLLMKRFGRKRTVFGYFLVAVGGWVVISFASSGWMLILGRVLNGIGYGGAEPAVPVYVGEIALTPIRGRLLSFVQGNFVAGALFSSILGYFFVMQTQTVISTVVVVVLATAVLLIPESPMFYLMKEKEDKARKSLKRLRTKDADLDEEVEEMNEFIQNQTSSGFKAFFREKSNLKALTISFGLFLVYELCGQNVVLFYTANIFQEAKVTINPNLGTIIVNLFSLAGTILSIVFVDKIGRKIFLLMAYSAAFLSFIAMGTYFYLQSSDSAAMSAWRFVPIVALAFYIFVISILCSITYIILGEIFAQNYKAISAGLTFTWDYTFSIIVTLSFPYLVDAINFSGLFFFFSIFNALGFVFILFVVPETRGKTFLEIQNLL